ncbi:hypothetical protein NPIL_69961 [Nephila pilipes]|uniref:CCHC-type domain-containing protein n=1 Tax=Nephila pilipes TaxID=299642 RepID=A0A8X6QH13_NEPPI|nr:hypothetical protein NPIL_69961 [Nephila pilipes]
MSGGHRSQNHASHHFFENKKPNKYVNFRRYENRCRRTENFKLERKYHETHQSKDFERRMPRECFNCHSPNHLSYNCPKVKKEWELARPSNFLVETCSVVLQKRLHLTDIKIFYFSK